jgi:large subunit ribosomal protein L10
MVVPESVWVRLEADHSASRRHAIRPKGAAEQGGLICVSKSKSFVGEYVGYVFVRLGSLGQEEIMALRLEDKKALVAEVNAVAATALSVVAAEYRGLTVSQMTDLRVKARNSGVYLRVVKNTLARKAVAGTQFEAVGSSLKGPLVLAFSKDDPGAAARLVKSFSKDNDKLKVTVLSLGGGVLSAKDVDRVASLPTKQQALGQLAGVLLAPISKFVRTVAEPHAKLVRTIAAVKDQKQAAGG